MNPNNKQQYLHQIRSNTAYPTYRGIIGVIALLAYILATLETLTAFVAGSAVMRDSFVQGLAIVAGGLVIGALIFLGARFSKEAALILADIGDSITDANSRDRIA